MKSIGAMGNAFVVYHCNNDWDNYLNYTGASTDLEDITIGWHDDEEDTLPRFKDFDSQYDK